MSGRCGHANVTGFVRWWIKRDEHPFAPRDAPIFVLLTLRSVGSSTHDVDAIRCNDCESWLPMGHSDETPERVAVEIRAAEIADDIAEADRLCDWTLGNEAFVSSTAFEERRGWSIAESSMREHSKAWLAGYLARCIATHKDETPMKQLDEMERMARGYDESGYSEIFAAHNDARQLARALLAVMPVARAALDWRDHGPGQSHCAEEDCPCTSAVCRLKIAIDDLRRRLGGE